MVNLNENLATLQRYSGVVGIVGSPLFSTIVDLLDEVTVFVEENESIGVWTDYIEDTYAAKLGGDKFTLWYEVRRPDTPQMELKFGFDLC